MSTDIEHAFSDLKDSRAIVMEADLFVPEGEDASTVVSDFTRAENEVVVKLRKPLAAMPVPEKYKFVPNGTPAGQPYNVAQAYARAAAALRGGGSFDADFDLAVKRHKLIDAIERSSATGRSVKLDP